jgi:hypothetical protein
MLKNKYFIRGLICGLIFGGGIVYFVYKYNIPVIEKIKYITIHDLSINTITKKFMPSNKETLAVKKDKTDKIKSQFKLSPHNSLNSASLKNDSIHSTQQITKSPNHQITKSINPADSEDRNINVVKEELIYTLEVPLEDKDLQKKNEEESKLSNELTDNLQTSRKEMLLVEFWKSPLNYQGYRMSANNLIIYGFADIETPDFIFFNSSVFMNDNDNYYHLENTEQFKPFVKITNTNLINQLKQSAKK